MTLHPSISLFQQALDSIEVLSPEEQWTVIDLIRNRLIERRRAEIARNSADTFQAVREGRSHHGGVDDLRRDLVGDF